MSNAVEVTAEHRRTFREQGYVVIPRVLSAAQIDRGLVLAGQLLAAEPVPAGSILLAHYLLAHNIGGHFGPPGSQWRRTFYYRISATGHKDRWRTIATDPMYEFR
jgi:hypothetical protein